MSSKADSTSPADGIFVSKRPIDFTGDTDTFDRQVQQEAQARDAMNRDLPLMGEARHSHARVFDAHRYSVRTYVPESEGTGYWDLYRLSQNMFVMIADCEYAQPKWLGTPDEGYFKIRLLWSGSMLNEERQTLLEAPGGMLALYPTKSHGGYYIDAGTPCRLVILHCRIAMLTEEMGIEPALIALPLKPPTVDEERPPLLQKIDLSPRVVSSTLDLLDLRDHYQANLRSWFVEAKAKEILTSVLQGLVVEPEIGAQMNRITRRDRHRILEVQEVIKANLSDLPTIPALSRMIGMNRTKLKSGFKAVVGCTIGEFTRRQQMEAAARMLQSGEQAISEIGFAVGYRHPANFSHAFKQYYGCLPSSVRRPTQQDRH